MTFDQIIDIAKVLGPEAAVVGILVYALLRPRAVSVPPSSGLNDGDRLWLKTELGDPILDALRDLKN